MIKYLYYLHLWLLLSSGFNNYIGQNPLPNEDPWDIIFLNDDTTKSQNIVLSPEELAIQKQQKEAYLAKQAKKKAELYQQRKAMFLEMFENLWSKALEEWKMNAIGFVDQHIAFIIIYIISLISMIILIFIITKTYYDNYDYN